MKVINLLPQTEQKIIQQEKFQQSFKKFLVACVLSYFLLSALLIGWRLYLMATLANVDSDIKKNQSIVDRQDNDTLRKQVMQINGTTTDYLTLTGSNPKWSKILMAFASLVPGDSIITSLNGNTQSGKIDIVGVGATRDSVLLLRSNIAGSPLFKNINLPLENLQKPTNVLFSYTFYLADGALRSNDTK
ncbi:MAG: hypothetical protein NVS3B9_5480 [Candidatus Doudnabacteria bacterium]